MALSLSKSALDRTQRWCVVAAMLAALLGCAPTLPSGPSSAAVNESASAVSPAPQAQRSAQNTERRLVPATRALASTLGTQWGEGRDSVVRYVPAERVTQQPQALRQIGYTDLASIQQALGRHADQQLNILLTGGKVEWSVLGDQEQALPIYSTRGAQDYRVAGKQGERYELQFVNRSQSRYEVVATVDGLDVLSGQPGSQTAGGYILEPGQTMRIDGFRKSASEVAAFRFARKPQAYASNTPAGDARNVGAMGVALFELKPTAPPQTPAGPQAFPADAGTAPYALPPVYR